MRDDEPRWWFKGAYVGETRAASGLLWILRAVWRSLKFSGLLVPRGPSSVSKIGEAPARIEWTKMGGEVRREVFTRKGYRPGTWRQLDSVPSP